MPEKSPPLSYDQWKSKKDAQIKLQQTASNLVDNQAMMGLLQFFSHAENIIANPRYYFRYLNERRRQQTEENKNQAELQEFITNEWRQGGSKTLNYQINDGIRRLDLQDNPHLMVKAEGFRDCVLVVGSSGGQIERHNLSALHVSSRVLDAAHGHGGDFRFNQEIRNSDLQGELEKTINTLLIGDGVPHEIHFAVVGGSPLLVDHIRERIGTILRNSVSHGTRVPILIIEEKRLDPKAGERKFSEKNYFVTPTKVIYSEDNGFGRLILKTLDY